jgi:hypothetical protein
MICQGKKYVLEVVSECRDDDSIFYVKAKDRLTNRTYCINNLNIILSAWDVDIDDPRFEDSMWLLSKKECSCFEAPTRSLLSEPFFIELLEHQLDEDRLFGEWKNIGQTL